MDEGKVRSERIIQYSPLASKDFSENFDHTALHWGWDQAERYAGFIETAITGVARDPDSGRLIDGFPDIRGISVRWPKAKYGHIIVYKPIQDGIYILRILHSAMNLDERLTDDEGA